MEPTNNVQSSKPLHYQEYVNYGLFESPAEAPLLRHRLDTWYYREGAILGTMEIGTGPVSAERRTVQFLRDSLTSFLDAFSNLIRLSSNVRAYVLYQKSLSSPGGYVARILPNQDWSQLSSFLETLPPSTVISLFGSLYDMRVALRDDDGTVVDRWLSNVGRLHVKPRLSTLHGDPAEEGQEISWYFELKIDILSLFQRNNSTFLERIRAAWRDEVQHNPGLTELSDEELSLAVTLAEGPSGTPPTNRELYEQNVPRLRAAIARWEHVTGSPFTWTVSLDENASN